MAGYDKNWDNNKSGVYLFPVMWRSNSVLPDIAASY